MGTAFAISFLQTLVNHIRTYHIFWSFNSQNPILRLPSFGQKGLTPSALTVVVDTHLAEAVPSEEQVANELQTSDEALTPERLQTCLLFSPRVNISGGLF